MTTHLASPSCPDTATSAVANAPRRSPRPRRRPRGDGTQRERRPGIWEVRVPADKDPVTSHTRHHSVTVHGTEADATAARLRLLATGRPAVPPPDRVTVGYLLQAWLDADHPWKPSTYVGYTSNARALSRDPLAQRPAAALSPHELWHRLAAWQTASATDAVLAARFRALRACLTWAYNERLLDTHPLRMMRGPHRAPPRQALAGDEVRALLVTAELRILEAQANLPRTTSTAASAQSVTGGCAAGTFAAAAGSAAWRRLRIAEQDLLLVRLAADSGARRGELAALRFDDLVGRVLHIQRAVSAGQVTTPKSGYGRSLTLGADTAGLWHRLHDDWSRRGDLSGSTPEGMDDDRRAARLGPWLFSADPNHQGRLGAEALGHRFEDLRDAAGIPTATLHRLRHTVATFLVSQGKILEAQDRLGHGDASTTLREYAHALPGRDKVVADAINVFLDLAKDSSGDLGPRTISHLDRDD